MASPGEVVEPKYFLKSERHEVLFPNSFTTVYPEGDTPIKLDLLGDEKIPIFDLVHVTHNADYRSICRNPMYEFKARQKFGKALYFEYDDYRKPRCGSYKSIKKGAQFERIGSDETVFPGFYSWWGIHPKSEYTRRIAAELEDMKEEEGSIAYVPNYLKDEPESYYGNRGFVCSFQNVLSSYAQSRKTQVANIFLRKGGTLRYTQEICYVIIVSTGDDRHTLKDFDPLPMSRPFHTNGLINRNGQVKDPTAIPNFCPKRVVTWFVNKFEGSDAETYSYETIAFAFYFPNERFSMKVRKKNCKTPDFFHDDEFCTKKQRPPRGGPSVCPNKLG